VTALASRYTRRHRIATGGMGEVWLAHDEVLHRDVAVKQLKQEYADDEGFRTRFLHEARNAASLHHPGIATVFDFGDGDEVPFLVMEYVEGKPLSELLADGRPLDPERARDLVEQAALALAEAHAAGLVHRDVKPGNLMVTPEGVVKVTDFGIARAGDGMALTETGQMLGTPAYLSPEQAEGKAATPASDVYALGVVLFQCLTGHRPFEAESPVAVALAHVREPVPELPPEVPADLAEVTHRALAKHAEDRYPDAGAFAAALAALRPEPTMVLGALPVVTPAAETVTAPLAVPVASRIAGSLSGPLAWIRSRPRWLVVAVPVALIVLVVAIVALGNGDATKDTPSSGSTTPTPRVSPSKRPTVSVDPASYVGKPVSVVRTALTALGLDSRVVTVDNPGGHAAGTVAAMRPTGTVRVGATVTLDVWGAAPKAATPKHGGKPGKGKGKGRH
jgi:serine/threonine-protein kinase